MADRRHMMIIVNPASARGGASRTAAAVSADLRSRGFDGDVKQTARSGDAERITRDACESGTDRPDGIVACGGDGTIQEISHALALVGPELGAACPPLGLAPAGRCNDFARALGVKPDPAMIADTLALAEPTPIDLGRVNERYFCTVATLGVDAEVSSYVDSMRVPLTGTVAYLYGAIRVLIRYTPCSHSR